MVRIKVVHASHLLAAAAAVILAVVLTALLLSSAGRAQPAQTEKAAQTVAAFSLSFLQPPPMEFELPGENEHTDVIVSQTPVPAPSADVIPAKAAPRVLIYHTHTHEAYAQTDGDPYRETETWRTEDQAHSVVRVGEALASLLTDYGFEVVHDATDHEYPRLNTAYARSLKTLEGYADQTFDLSVDLHRDAYDSSMDDCGFINGRRAAQLMMLVGDGGSFAEQPDYEANLAFASRLTDCVNALCPGLCRPVMVKNGRYNQHVFTPSLLIEVGHNLNTLSEALSSMPALAEALCALLKA